MIKKKASLKNIIFLQVIIIIYTFSTVLGKVASGYEFLSGLFILFFALDVVVLGLYAILWQQALKRFDLHVAYANRQLVVIWGLVWSALIFNEGITVYNIIGVVIIVGGVMLVNSDAE